MAEEIIKDPYIFDFIPNAKKLREIELEDALAQQITKLLLEFGSGFAFMGIQYPIQVGNREFFIDLLFYLSAHILNCVPRLDFTRYPTEIITSKL